MEKIYKITLTADNGVFKGLIHEIAHAVVYKKELEKFKFIFSANILETSIIITETSVSNSFRKTGLNYNNF